MSGLEVHVICCDGPPTIIPLACGQHWIDTLNRVHYTSVGTASIADWICEDQSVIKLMDCDASVAVDDLVYQDPSTNNLAVKATNNTALQPVIGHVIHKPSSTTCVVQLKGVLPFTIGRGRVWLSQTGTYTNTPPTNSGGYVQSLGWSCGDGRVEINPLLQRVKRS